MKRTGVFLLIVLFSGMFLPRPARTDVSFGEEIVIKVG